MIARGQYNKIVNMVLARMEQKYIVIVREGNIPQSKAYTKQVFLGLVLKHVSEEVRISEDKIMAGSRKAPGPHARQLYFHLCDLFKPGDIDDESVSEFIKLSRCMATSAPKFLRRVMDVDKKFAEEIKGIEERFKQKINIL